MYHSQVNEFKYEIERLNRELQDMKKKYYRLRKKQAERLPYVTPMIEKIYTDKRFLFCNYSDKVIKSNPHSGVRFSGGGFNLSALPHNEFETPANDTVKKMEKLHTHAEPPLPTRRAQDDRSDVYVGLDEVLQNEDIMQNS